MESNNLDIEKLLAFLNDKWKEHKCGVCGHFSWDVTNKLFQLSEFNKSHVLVGGKKSYVPLIPVTCDNCGNTLLLSAMIAGLVKPNKIVDESDGKEVSDGKE